MPDALDKLRAGADKANTKLAAQRLGGREYAVQVQSMTAGDSVAGTPATPGATITLTPRPKVNFRDQYRMTDGGLVRVGDCRVSRISRVTYTETQLRGVADAPTEWTINGRKFRVIDLEPKPTEFVATLMSKGG